MTLWELKLDETQSCKAAEFPQMEGQKVYSLKKIRIESKPNVTTEQGLEDFRMKTLVEEPSM